MPQRALSSIVERHCARELAALKKCCRRSGHGEVRWVGLVDVHAAGALTATGCNWLLLDGGTHRTIERSAQHSRSVAPYDVHPVVRPVRGMSVSHTIRRCRCADLTEGSAVRACTQHFSPLPAEERRSVTSIAGMSSLIQAQTATQFADASGADHAARHRRNSCFRVSGRTCHADKSTDASRDVRKRTRSNIAQDVSDQR